MSESELLTPSESPIESHQLYKPAAEFAEETWQDHTGNSDPIWTDGRFGRRTSMFWPYPPELLVCALVELHKMDRLHGDTKLLDQPSVSLAELKEFFQTKPLSGLRVASIGGPEAYMFAELGAHVTAVDPNMVFFPKLNQFNGQSIMMPLNARLAYELQRQGLYDLVVSNRLFSIGSGLCDFGEESPFLLLMLRLTSNGGLQIHCGDHQRHVFQSDKVRSVGGKVLLSQPSHTRSDHSSDPNTCYVVKKVTKPPLKVTIKPETNLSHSFRTSLLGGTLSEPTLCGNSNLLARQEKLQPILQMLMNKTTEGSFKWEDITESQRILDLGAGRGSLGALLRANHSESKTTQYLCGVETTPYQGDQATDMYDHWVDGDLTDSKVWEYLIQQEIDFDLVFAIGLPPAVIKSLTQNTMLKHLISRGGRLVILTDFYLPENLNQESGWRIYSGDAYIDKHVAIYQKE